MKVVNLKRDEPELRDEVPCDYPWALRISLYPDVLEKLGLAALPSVGATIKLEGAAIVIAVRDDGMDRCVELQITDLGLDKPKKSAAAILYDKE